MSDELNKLIDDTASGKEPLPPGVTRMHPAWKLPNEYVREIVRDELTKILTDIERRPEVEHLYDSLQDKMDGKSSGSRRRPENEAVNALVRDILESIKKEK